jgi:outer membrane biosynthesis protein TonB
MPMASSPDLLTQIRSELDARLRELRPLLSEYERLLVAAEALVLEDASGDAPSPRRRVAPKTPARVSEAPTPPPKAPTPPPKAPTPPPKAPTSAPKAPTPAPKAPTPAPKAPTPAPKAPTPAPKAAPVSAPAVPVKPPPRRRDSAPKRAQRGAAAVAIVAALEHGSHTVSELTIVTAMSGAIIQSNLRRLQQAGTITRTKRAGDGKAAYALTIAPV